MRNISYRKLFKKIFSLPSLKIQLEAVSIEKLPAAEATAKDFTVGKVKAKLF